MGYHLIKPPEHLADYVRCFWVLESDIPYQHHAVADGLAEMVFHYHGTFNEVVDGRESSSWLSGLQAQSQRTRKFVTQASFGIFGVYLYPYALSTLFSIPADALSNEMPDLHSLLGNDGVVLEEKIMLASSLDERVGIITNFITQKIRQRNSSLDKMSLAVRHVLLRQGQISVKQMADEFSLSVRQFERLFKKSSGFSPKLYARIIRFTHALRSYDHQQTTLTALAHACGYYDQAHFMEDFKMFSGVSPKRYFDAILVD